jgi:hypothetical protein
MLKEKKQKHVFKKKIKSVKKEKYRKTRGKIKNISNYEIYDF